MSAIVDLTLSVRILRVRSSKLCLGAPSIRALVYYQQVKGKWVVQRPRGILEKRSLGMTRMVEGKRFREEGNSNKTVSRVRSDKCNADAKDKRWRPVRGCFTQSCDQLQGLSMSAVLPQDVEAVLCKFVLPLYLRRFTHENHYKTHPRRNKRTECWSIRAGRHTHSLLVHTKSPGPVSWQTPAHSM